MSMPGGFVSRESGDKDGYLLDLYGVYWVAYDIPPGEKEDT